MNCRYGGTSPRSGSLDHSVSPNPSPGLDSRPRIPLVPRPSGKRLPPQTPRFIGIGSTARDSQPSAVFPVSSGVAILQQNKIGGLFKGITCHGHPPISVRSVLYSLLSDMVLIVGLRETTFNCERGENLTQFYRRRECFIGDFPSFQRVRHRSRYRHYPLLQRIVYYIQIFCRELSERVYPL